MARTLKHSISDKIRKCVDNLSLSDSNDKKSIMNFTLYVCTMHADFTNENFSVSEQDYAFVTSVIYPSDTRFSYNILSTLKRKNQAIFGGYSICYENGSFILEAKINKTISEKVVTQWTIECDTSIFVQSLSENHNKRHSSEVKETHEKIRNHGLEVKERYPPSEPHPDYLIFNERFIFDNVSDSNDSIVLQWYYRIAKIQTDKPPPTFDLLSFDVNYVFVLTYPENTPIHSDDLDLYAGISPSTCVDIYISHEEGKMIVKIVILKANSLIFSTKSDISIHTARRQILERPNIGNLKMILSSDIEDKIKY